MTLREALQKLNKEKIVKEAIAKHETVKELPEKEKEKKTEMLKRGYENAIRELLLLEKSDSEGKILVDWFLDLYLDVWLV